MIFTGPARRIEDLDLPRIASSIRVGEDELHMIMDVECAGTGFDSKGRPRMLFEPHVFYRNLSGSTRQTAIERGLAYRSWGQEPYPRDSYPRLERAMEIDEEAALRSASWGLGQILGENHRKVGFDTARAMVLDFTSDEENHLEAVVQFMVSCGIDDELRDLAALRRPTRPEDCAPIALVYNGRGYKRHGYHVRLARAHNRWRAIPDTPWPGAADAMPPPPARPILDYRDRNEWVRDLQRMLNIDDDGIFGPATRAAVMSWQDIHGLKVDGVVGPATWASLDNRG